MKQLEIVTSKTNLEKRAWNACNAGCTNPDVYSKLWISNYCYINKQIFLMPSIECDKLCTWPPQCPIILLCV